MEKAKSPDRSLLVTILVLVSLNAAASVLFVILMGLAVASNNNDKTAAGDDTVPLPAELAAMEDRVRLLDDFVDRYNSGDKERLLSMFGDAYRVQITAADFDGKMDVIRSITPSIDSGFYACYEFRKLGSGLTEFSLFYNLSTPVGPRELTLVLVQQGEDPAALRSFNLKMSG